MPVPHSVTNSTPQQKIPSKQEEIKIIEVGMKSRRVGDIILIAEKRTAKEKTKNATNMNLFAKRHRTYVFLSIIFY